MSLVAHQPVAYPVFLAERLGVYLFTHGWDILSPSQGSPSSKFAGTHLYIWVRRGTMRVKGFAQEHNPVSWPRLEPGPFDPEYGALSISPPVFFFFFVKKTRIFEILLF